MAITIGDIWEHMVDQKPVYQLELPEVTAGNSGHMTLKAFFFSACKKLILAWSIYGKVILSCVDLQSFIKISPSAVKL